MKAGAGRRAPAAALLLLLLPGVSRAAHYVSVEPARPLRQPMTIAAAAEVVDDTVVGASFSGSRPYHLAIRIPDGAKPDAAVGDALRLSLPIIHNARVLAKVTAVSEFDISLLLSGQVQRLQGLEITAELPLKPVNLYLIPFQAVYSPRGITTEVFVLQGDSRVRLVPVKPLAIRDNGDLIVSSSHLAGAKVVVDGLDNLVSGDLVSVLP